MTKDWTFKVGLWECSKMYQQTVTEENLPFVPKEGNVFWTSDSCENRLRIKIRKCLKKMDAAPDAHSQTLLAKWT